MSEKCPGCRWAVPADRCPGATIFSCGTIWHDNGAVEQSSRCKDLRRSPLVRHIAELEVENARLKTQAEVDVRVMGEIDRCRTQIADENARLRESLNKAKAVIASIKGEAAAAAIEKETKP